jgi:hypothetical protein
MSVKLIKVAEGEDSRDQARYHLIMIMGARQVTIIDNKLKRWMELDVSPDTLAEDNYAEIFANLVEALRLNGEIADGEMAACITFPAGTTQIEVPLRGQA